MNRFMIIFQWVLLVGIFAVGFRDSYRAQRITRFTIYFTWILLPIHALVFCLYAQTLEGSGWRDFPDGQHVLMYLVFGWLYGLTIAVLAVGSWRAIHGKPLFQPEADDKKPDA